MSSSRPTIDVVDTARRDPEVLVGGSTPVTIDEVQRGLGNGGIWEQLRETPDHQ